MPFALQDLFALQALFALQDSGPMQSLQSVILRGGYMMIPIGICSLVALAFALERWLSLRNPTLGSKRLARNILEAAQDGGVQAARDVCSENKSTPLARIIDAGLARMDTDFAQREKVVEDAAHVEIHRLSRNLRPLFLVWLIAPLLGLLGTVWGMIRAFGDIAGEGGLGRPEVLADGIYGALTTTAGGLAVAIPAIVFYWFFQGRIESFAARIETSHRDVENALRPTGPKPVPAREEIASHSSVGIGS